MTDLRELSSEDLAAIAGVPLAGSNLSDIADDELMQIAGVEKPKAATPRQPGEPGITATKPSFLEELGSPLIGTPGDRTLLGRAIYGQEATPQAPDYDRGLNLPLVKLEEFIPRGTAPTEFARGVLKAGSELTTPSSVALLGGVGTATAMGGKVLARLVSGGFAADMAHALYQQSGEFKKAVDAGDINAAANLAGQMTAAGAFAGIAGRHATKGLRSSESRTLGKIEPSPIPTPLPPYTSRGPITMAAEPIMQGLPTEDLIRIVADTNRLRPGEVPFSETVSPPESPAVTFGERPPRFAPIRGPESRVEAPALKPAEAPLQRKSIEPTGISPKATDTILTPSIDLKTIPTEQLLKLATDAAPEMAPTKLQKKEFRLGTVGEPDLLNVIDDIGGIRPRTKSGDPANYDGFDEVIPQGETRLLVRKSGLAPDDLRQALSNRGHGFETTSQMYEAIARAKETRQALRGKQGDDHAAQKFAEAALVETKNKEPLSVASLKVGDEFKIKGEPFKVSTIEEDGTVTVEDGRKFGRQELIDEQVFYPDRNSVKLAAPDESFEFRQEPEPPAVSSIADLSRTLADASRKAKGEAANEIVGQLGMKAAGPLRKAGNLEGSPLFPGEEKQGGLFGGGSLADKGGYAERARTSIELPEIVELARGINEGKYPSVTERLRNALGRFQHRGDEGKILLRADIFLGEQINQKSIKPGDADAIKSFQESVRQSSGIPEDKLAFRQEFNRKTGLVDLKAYRKDPTLAPKVLAHEVGHVVDWLPDKDLARGNILGRIASLKKYLKTLLDEIPTDPSKALTPKERAKLRTQAKRETEAKGPGASKEEFNAEVSTRYKELLEEEIGSRNLITREAVTDELKAVTQEWKPFDESADADYTRYRYSSKELYADAVSVLVNEPAMLQDQAPTFWKSFLSYLERKPEVKGLYDDLQHRIGNREAVTEARLENVYGMLERGNEGRQRLNERNAPKPEDLKDSVMRWLVDKQHAALKVLRGQEKFGGTRAETASKARYDLEEVNYLASEAENYIHEIGGRVLKPMQQAGLTAEDMGAYLFLERARQERTEIANPLGHTGTTAAETVQGLKARLGEQKFEKLKGLTSDYRNLREELILPRLEASGMFKPELMDRIKSNKAYARFSVQKYLEEAYGSGTTAKIFKQIGTLSEIENPLVATVLQDISMLRAAKINEAKTSLAALLRNEPGLITPAEMRYSLDARGRVPKPPKNFRQGVLTLMADGKPEHFYISKAIADSFERTPFEATKVAEIISTLNRPIRDLLVSKNPLWMARNVFRDVRATVKNLPEVGLTGVGSLGRAYKQAFGEAWRDVMRGERSEDISEMMRGRMLSADRVYSAKEQTFDNELERLATEFQVNGMEHLSAPGARNRLKQAYTFLDKLGRVSEVTGKIAGYKLLKADAERSPQEIGHVVRTRVGTPDYKRQGEAQAITNNLFLFSNVNKEGLRSALESFNEDRSGYVWKTVATNILPKLMLAAGAAGLGGETLKKIIEGIPNYDKRMYSVVPLGLNQQGKSIYLRIPEDYEGQFWGGLVWELMRGQLTGKEGAISLTAEQSPYRLHPLLEVSSDLFQYYVKSINPLDEYRGRSVLPDQVFRAGGAEAHKTMAKYAWKNLGGTVLYNPSGNQMVTDESALEKALKTFPLNTLGTFLKISDQGVSERLEDVRGEVSQKRAGKVIDVQQRIRDSIRAAGGKPTAQEAMQLFMDLQKENALPPGTTLREFTSRYQHQAGKSAGNPYVEAIARASSNEERAALLDHYRRNLKPEEYRLIVQQIQKEGVVSPRSLLPLISGREQRKASSR